MKVALFFVCFDVNHFKAGKSFKGWQPNRITVNIQLRRYLARATFWPDQPTATNLASLAKLSFFPD